MPAKPSYGWGLPLLLEGGFSLLRGEPHHDNAAMPFPVQIPTPWQTLRPAPARVWPARAKFTLPAFLSKTGVSILSGGRALSGKIERIFICNMYFIKYAVSGCEKAPIDTLCSLCRKIRAIRHSGPPCVQNAPKAAMGRVYGAQVPTTKDKRKEQHPQRCCSWCG